MNQKVLLILVDGMRPEAIRLCGNPGFPKLFESGTYTYSGTTVSPPVTLPCHMSLFHSVDPCRHGTCDNIYMRQVRPVTGLVECLAAAKKTTAFFYSWEQLRDLCTPGNHLGFSWFMSDHFMDGGEIEPRATAAAQAYIAEFAPDFVFLYLGNTDIVGHRCGWMTEEYLQAVKNASFCIEKICRTLPEEYAVIITADHGGHDRTHGMEQPEDLTIPIAFLGESFARGKQIPACDIKDLAPTITELLGVEPDPEWEGRSRLER